MHINCHGKLIDLSTPRVMGIINVTPDSFYDGGKYLQEKAVLDLAEKHLQEGATFLDLGGQSSRPGAEWIPLDLEISRVVPMVEAILKRFPEALISVDTVSAQVAQAAVEAGAAMINDISAGDQDPQMLESVAALQVPYVMMHMQGTPQTMQNNPQYKNVTQEVQHYFSLKLQKLNKLGLNDVILDPGFGFGKTKEHNYQLLKDLPQIGFGEFPILVGVSRKSMIYKALGIGPEDALNGSTVLHTIALMKKAYILRVHDVRPAMEAIKLMGQFPD